MCVHVYVHVCDILSIVWQIHNKQKLYYACTVFHVEEVSLDDTAEWISPIEGEIAKINIPIEVFESAERGASVRMASFLFRNMSGLLPESLNDGVQNDLLVLT